MGILQRYISYSFRRIYFEFPTSCGIENLTNCNKNKKIKILRVTRRETLNIPYYKNKWQLFQNVCCSELETKSGNRKKNKKSLQKQCIM